jgi:hypothetical protein
MSIKSFSDKVFSKGYSKCSDTHPNLLASKGMFLYGGACGYPIHKDCDVYVCLQSGSSSGLTNDPWEEQHVVEIHYSINDGCAPSNTARFKKMIDYLCNQLQAGKKVHVGCIGGHGRTGIVMSAIVAQLLGEKAAISYVRKHYCQKAVESRSQVKFLMANYGVDKVEGSKEGLYDELDPRSKANYSGFGLGSKYGTYSSSLNAKFKEWSGDRVTSASAAEEVARFRAAKSKREEEKAAQAPKPSGTSRTCVPCVTARSIFRKKKVKK